MSGENIPETPSLPSSGRLILTLATIAMMSGFVVVFVYQVTLEPIARNHRMALEKAVFTVIPGADTRVNYLLESEGLKRLDDEDIDRANLFAGYDAEGSLIGVAMQASARGYADVIRVLYGYSPERECIIGFTVLQSSETPGLGDKIETDPDFLANFECLDVSLNQEQTGLDNEIRAVRQGTKTEPWQIDGITGATISVEAVARALRESADRMLPILAGHLYELTEPDDISPDRGPYLSDSKVDAGFNPDKE